MTAFAVQGPAPAYPGAAGDESGKLPRRPLDPLLERAVGAEVLGRREDAGGDDDGVQVGEQRPERMVQHERVPRRTGGGGDEDRLAVERVLVQDVEERLEQPGVRRREHRRDDHQAVRAVDPVDRGREVAAREAGQQVVGQCVRERPQLDDLDLDLCPARLDRPLDGVAEQVGQQPGRRRDAETGRERR